MSEPNDHIPSDCEMQSVSSAPATAPRVEFALWCARTIGPVFRCVRNGKQPMKAGWQAEATTEEAAIRKWFDVPDPPNIGIATGRASCIVVVDLDMKDGKDGCKALAALAAAYGTTLAGSKTLTVLTPSSGLHLVYRVPAHVAAMTGNAGILGEGIDIRAAGNLVVGAGSKIDGRPYRVFVDAPIADMPQWLVDAFIESKAPKMEARNLPDGVEVSGDAPHDIAQARAYLAEVQDIDGYDNAMAIGRRLGDLGILPETAAQLFDDEINPRLPAGREWDMDELVMKMNDWDKGRENAFGSDSYAAKVHDFDELPDDFADLNDELIAAANDNDGQAGILARNTLDIAELSGKPIPKRNWHVEGWIPGNNVTLLYGDGGTGKSLLAMQLAVATAAERPWLGLPVRPGRVIYLTAEDDGGELHRRIADIASHEDLSLRNLARNLTVVSLVADDPALAVPRDADRIKPTSLWRELVETIDAFKPKLIILDTLADVFAANENGRSLARSFIAQLRAPAIAHDAAFVVLAHPSRAGLATPGLNAGAGSSGSTAWHNSVRSRLELARGDEKKNPDGRTLTAKKANYSRAGATIPLRWENGVFEGKAEATTAESEAAAREAERVFLELLDAYTAERRHVSAATGTTYAPAMFADDAGSRAIDKGQLTDAMNRLFHAGVIQVVTTGPASRRRSHIARVEPSAADGELSDAA